MIYHQLTEKIIGCAFQVYNQLGFGYLESVYEKCLLIEFRKIGIKAASQYPLTVHYDGVVVGEFKADIIVNDTIIIELKSVRLLKMIHEVQLVNYLTATGIETGLLVNFGEEKVEIKRKYRRL